MKAYRIYTIADGEVEKRARIETFSITSGLPAIIIGEEGRGRRLGVMPVQLLPENHQRWESGESLVIQAATVSSNRYGRPVLVEAAEPESDDAIIAVLRTPIGYRGDNAHTGDRYTVPCPLRGQHVRLHYICPECRTKLPVKDSIWDEPGPIHPDEGEKPMFKECPLTVLVTGRIAQGDAGAMGSGHQIIGLLPKGAVLRTAYGGRRYGRPGSHYYLWNGEAVLAATFEEREVVGF